MPRLLLARGLLLASDRWAGSGALLVHAGRVERVLRGARAVERAESRDVERVDLGDVVLAPGFVNAHAHLELPALAAGTPKGGDFHGWIGAVLAARARLSPEDWTAAWERAAARLLHTGTTLVADIDSTAAWSRSSTRVRPRVSVLREFLDAFDARRTPAMLARLSAPRPRRARLRHGLSPHAPHTVGDALLDAIAHRARAERPSVGVHWAETPEERAWLEHGRGPFAARLGPSPRTSGLDRLAARGLLGPRTLLFHGNDARGAELERIVQSGATVVHCPGTHAWFEREPVPLADWARRGVRIALGTDSLASNSDLDLGLELARLRTSHPGLAPGMVFAWATQGGAQALGAGDRAGELRAGSWADFVAWRTDADTLAAGLEALTARGAAVDSVWLAGERVVSPALHDRVREW